MRDELAAINASPASPAAHTASGGADCAGPITANRDNCAAGETPTDRIDPMADVRIAERPVATASELDTIREQLASLLAATSEQRSSTIEASDAARARTSDGPSVASQPHRFSTCTLLSILLNAAAFSAAAAIGTRQLWRTVR
eukprot:3007028-Pleurochrysis_carterae.AAC.3